VLLTRLQTELAAMYAAPVGHDVHEFLITDARLAAALTPDGAPTTNRERLLVQQSDGELALSLYIDDHVLSALGADDPIEFLHDGNLDDFLIALEGVSHLQYLLFRAEHARPVSLLELELQAEVDKYVAAARLVSVQGDGRVPRALHARLFEQVRFDGSLAAAELARYLEANQLAARYCHELRRRYPGHHREASFMGELRGFYRLGGREKIGRILSLR
jgi:hypothetical protein